MEQNKLDRINELAKKAKAEGLSPQEKEEQARLRQEYIALFRRNVRQQLENVVYVDEEGNEVPLKKKSKVDRIRLDRLQ